MPTSPSALLGQSLNVQMQLGAAASNPSGYAMPTTAPPGLTIVQSDDFTGGSVDTSKWFTWAGAPGAGNYAWWDATQLDTTTLSSCLTITTVSANHATHSSVPNDGNRYYLAGGIGSKVATSYGGADVMMRRVNTIGQQTAVLLFWPDAGTWPQDQEIDFYEDSGDASTSMAMTFHWGPILTYATPTTGTYSGLVPTNGSPVYAVAGGCTITGTPHLASVTPITSTTGTFTSSGGTVTLAGANTAVSNSQSQLSLDPTDASNWHVWSVRWLNGGLYYGRDGELIGTMLDPINIGAPTTMNLDIQVEHEGTNGQPPGTGHTYDQTQIDWVVQYSAP